MTPERLRQVEELYHAACERGRGVLDGHGVDADTRREVESLLAQDASGTGMPQSNPLIVMQNWQSMLKK